MPEPLIAATAQRRAGTIDADTHATRIAARRPYHLRRNCRGRGGTWARERVGA
jgi:hypothetical protein